MSVALWKKVSEKQFAADGGVDYQNISLPKRATDGSAGYDLFAADLYVFAPHQQIAVASGVRCQMRRNFVMFVLPKSGLGVKYNLRLANTVGVVDSDYYGAKNEGHLLVHLINGDKPLTIDKGQAYAQAVFLKFYKAKEQRPKDKRLGGFGSTGN